MSKFNKEANNTDKMIDLLDMNNSKLTNPGGRARKPYPLWTYIARSIWTVVQSTLWGLCWKRVIFLRPAIMRVFGAKIPLRSLISGGVKFHFPWAFQAGNDIAIGPDVVFYNLGGVKLGSRVVISQNAYLCGGTHDYTISTYPLITKPIVIEDDVWVCAGAFLGPGITIGQGAVVGARSVVTKDVPPWKVVAGNPARVIKDRKMK
jgi:putative colanic acid biosynthesis acetyltransferase WcaF